MKTLLLVAGIFAALLVVALLVGWIAGARMPREHRSVVTATLRAPRDVVWNAITDYAALPSWWPAVKSVRTEKLADGTELTWTKDSHGHEIPYRTGDSRPGEKLVRVIATDELPFGGQWTFALADAAGGGTTLVLTEDGTINPALFRVIATWFIGLDATQKDFIAHLEKRVAAK